MSTGDHSSQSEQWTFERGLPRHTELQSLFEKNFRDLIRRNFQEKDRVLTEADMEEMTEAVKASHFKGQRLLWWPYLWAQKLCCETACFAYISQARQKQDPGVRKRKLPPLWISPEAFEADDWLFEDLDLYFHENFLCSKLGVTVETFKAYNTEGSVGKWIIVKARPSSQDPLQLNGMELRMAYNPSLIQEDKYQMYFVRPVDREKDGPYTYELPFDVLRRFIDQYAIVADSWVSGQFYKVEWVNPSHPRPLPSPEQFPHDPLGIEGRSFRDSRAGEPEGIAVFFPGGPTRFIPKKTLALYKGIYSLQGGNIFFNPSPFIVHPRTRSSAPPAGQPR
ncbi:hypothetical protein T439DRAFT_359511 [Meredithblackwellia eburnea MCA 4105]